MQNQLSNLVYVVSLSNDTFCASDMTFMDVVEKHRKYFHPVGGDKRGWPSEPPNYIAFRYKGELQSIHHIQSYTVIENYYPYFPVPESSVLDSPHFMYTLGPPIKPTHRIPTNDPDKKKTKIIRSARKWCFIDLLLTCDSIAEAACKTQDRKREMGKLTEDTSET